MKRSWYVISVFLLMGLTAWAQGVSAPFDMAKSEKELEIMRGIFKTTLSYDSDDSQGVNFFQFAEIRYMYLEDQGANFFMKVLDFNPQEFNLNLGFDSSLLESRLKMTEENLKRLQENLKRNEQSVADFYFSRSESQDSDKDTVNEFNRAQQNYEKYITEAFSSAEEALTGKQEAMKQNIQTQKAMIEKQQENRRPKMPEIKESLIEAVANYGDSLTVVKPDEYINLVFDTSGQYDIVSIQKSWIKDYKAGKLTLDQLKGKTIQYSMKGR
ncbi:MAG: hypothetical protein JXR49_21750 [Acidobacteria bacterium]|nr:hypothetical protein [Acidobacteriota bacterium]